MRFSEVIEGLIGSAKVSRRDKEPLGSPDGLDLPRPTRDRIGREPKNDSPEREPSRTGTNNPRYTPLPVGPVKTSGRILALLVVANGRSTATVFAPPRARRATLRGASPYAGDGSESSL